MKVRHTAFILLLSFPHLLFAYTAFAISSNTNNGLGRHYDMAKSANNNSVFTPQPITICSGANIVIKGDVQPTVPDTYLWQVLQAGVWVNAPGVNNGADYPPSLLINNTSNNIIYNIRRQTITAGATNYDSYYDVTVLTTAPILNNLVTSPATAVFCTTGNPTPIIGSTPTGGIGGFVYQWQISNDNITFADIPGANSIDYTPAPVTVTTYFRRIVIGSCTVASVSNSISITILTGISNSVITAPVVSGFCVSGDPAIINGNTPTGGSGAYIYQWQSSTDAINFTDISGATGKDYDPPAINITTFYRRLVTTGTCTVPVYSNVVIINILPAVGNNTITPPAVTSFCVAGSPAAIIGTTPTGGNGGYTYQWQISADSITFVDITGATSKDYTPAPISSSTYYRRVAISGSCATPLTSNIIGLKTTPLPTVPVLAPTSTTICPGSVSTFSIANVQAGMTYNWYDSPAKTTLLYTGTTYTTAPIFTTTVLYIENTNGTCASTSSTVVINVIPPPSAPLLASNAVSSCNGYSATLSIAGAQPGYIYNWYTVATGGTPVYTGANYTTPALFTNTTYYAEGTNTATGCISSSRTPVTVSMPPVDPITVQGASACPGTSATLSATTASGNATITWYTTATGGTAVSTGNTYTTPAIIANTQYYVEATNSITGCVSASRVAVQAQIILPLPAPVVVVDSTNRSTVYFSWQSVAGATGYLVSIDNGITFIAPSSGSAGLTHAVTGLIVNQQVTLLVVAVGTSACQLSPAGKATGTATDQADQIYVPNAFTPNGDGKNDQIFVRSQSIKTLKFYVYSQWGELLFTTTDPNNGWDGTFKGTKEPVGVYVYYLTAELLSGQEVSKKGTITLLK